MNHTADLGTRYRYREEGKELERERITNFINENRTEIVDGVYRDHFTSEDLLRFINGEDNE